MAARIFAQYDTYRSTRNLNKPREYYAVAWREPPSDPLPIDYEILPCDALTSVTRDARLRSQTIAAHPNGTISASITPRISDLFTQQAPFS